MHRDSTRPGVLYLTSALVLSPCPALWQARALARAALLGPIGAPEVPSRPYFLGLVKIGHARVSDAKTKSSEIVTAKMTDLAATQS